MSTLQDRTDLKHALYRLLNTQDSDDALSEHGTQSDNVDYLLSNGLWEAQRFMIRHGMKDRWVTTTQIPLSGNSWNDPSDNPGEYTALPSDFMRLAGTRTESALHEKDGDRWGMLSRFEDRHALRGNRYWLQNEDLWVAEGAQVPTNLYMDYHHRLPAPTKNTTVDFPKESRPLIVAEAAKLAIQEAWIPGGREMMEKIERHRLRAKRNAHKHARRSNDPNRLRPKRTIGTRMAGYRF